MNDDNWYEIYYPSRVTVDDLSAFVKSNAHSTVRTLTRLSADFIEEQLGAHQKRAYFVDFFAPVFKKFSRVLRYHANETLTLPIILIAPHSFAFFRKASRTLLYYIYFNYLSGCCYYLSNTIFMSMLFFLLFFLFFIVSIMSWNFIMIWFFLFVSSSRDGSFHLNDFFSIISCPFLSGVRHVWTYCRNSAKRAN